MPTMIRGQKGTQNLSTYRIKYSIAEGIALVEPNANPVTYLSQKMNKIAIGARKRSWLTDVYRPEFAQVNGGTTTTDTEITVDTASYFAEGDIWRVHDTGETVYVTAVDTSGNTLAVTRNFGTMTSGEPGYRAAITDNDWLEFIGNTLLEGTTAPTAMHTTEVQYDNYTQIQRTVLKLTNDDVAMLVYGAQDLPYEVKKKAKEHSRKVEKQHLWGAKPLAESGTTPAQSGGLWWFLRKYGSSGRVKTETDITEDEFLTWVRHCFRYGSGNKVLYASPLMLEAISRWAGNHLQIKSGDSKWGLNIQKLITPHGNLGIVNHKDLEGPVEGGGSYNHAFILDMDDITYCHVKGRDTALLTGRQANDADENMQEYLVESCLQIKNFNWHGYLYGYTSFSV